MSTINPSNFPNHDLLAPAHKSALIKKQGPKHKNPLTDANPPALTQANKPGASESAETQRARAREAAEGLVATSFIKPILAQVRESNNAPAPFGPTQAEKQFGSLLDNQLADEIARASQFPIVDRMVEQFTRHLGEPKQGDQGIDLNA